MREDGASPHHTINFVMMWGAAVYMWLCICLLMYSRGTTEREVPAQYIDGKVIKVPTIKMMPLDCSVCGICTALFFFLLLFFVYNIYFVEIVAAALTLSEIRYC